MIDPHIRFLPDIPSAQAAARPDAVAIRFQGRDTTFAELDRRTDAFARVLLAKGIAPQDRVAWLSRNDDTFFEAAFGAMRVRAVLCPINVRLAPAELCALLADARPRLMFVSAEFAEMAQGVLAELAEPPELIRLDADYPRLRGTAPAVRIDVTPQAEDDVLQPYTSGTTGAHKGVRLTNANYEFFLQVSPQVEGFDYQADDTVLLVMPLFHVAGFNIGFAGLAHGSRLVIVPEVNPQEILRLIAAERVAHAFLAPAIILMLLQTPGIETTDMSSLKTIAYGASPISEAVLSEAKVRFGCDFVQFYGSTESTGAGSYLAPSAHVAERLRSCGKPWPGLDVRVCAGDHPASGEAAQGAVGQIAIKGPVVMAGYWAKPQATAEAIVDGWLMTGDAGYRDADGFIYMHDRVKDMIVTGGENVYPAEVENAIFGCPGVADVAVIGVPSDRWGEEVKALVVRAPGSEVSAEQVVAWARARIAGYKTPKSVEFIGPLPRNPSGKVLRRELRAPYWEGRERAIA